MAANLNRQYELRGPSVTRLRGAMDQMAEGLEVLEAELLVAAMRHSTSLTPWTHDKLSAIAEALDDLRDAIETSPRSPD